MLYSTFAVDVDVAAGLDHGGLDKPRQTQADEDVEHVAAHSVGDSHVSVACAPTQSEQCRQVKNSLNRVATICTFISSWKVWYVWLKGILECLKL